MGDDKYAENLVSLAKEHPAFLAPALCASSAAGRAKSIHDRIVELYIELCKSQPPSKMCRSASNLLAKLVKRDSLSCLVVNLLPQSEGYTLAFKGNSGAEGETVKLPYEESEFLEYLDNGELSPVIADLLEKSPSNLFYSGCVICEVRDYRRNVDANYQSRYVLLLPTNQSLLADINSLTSDGRRWLAEDRLMLESQLLLATERPLCLDPSPAVSLAHNRLQYERRALHGVAVKRMAKRYSQVSRNRQKLLSTARSPPELRLHDFLVQRRRSSAASSSSGSANATSLRIGKPVVDMWIQPKVDLAPPKTIDVEKYAKVFERCRALSGSSARRPASRTLSTSGGGDASVIESFSAEDDCCPVVVDEFTLETERIPGKIHYTRLVLLQRPSDEMFLGELHVDRDYAEGKERELASCCKFDLGNKDNVNKYVKQFFEIFTEEGRRQVKITRSRPGQISKVTFTQQGQGTPWPVSPMEDDSSNTQVTHSQQQSAGAPAYQLQPSMMSAGGDGPASALSHSPQQLRLPLSHGGSAGSAAINAASNVALSGRQQQLLQQSTQHVKQQLGMLGGTAVQAPAGAGPLSAVSGTAGGLALIGGQLSAPGPAQLTAQPSMSGTHVIGTMMPGRGSGGGLLLTTSSAGGLNVMHNVNVTVTSGGLQHVQQLPGNVVTTLPLAGNLSQQQQQPTYLQSPVGGNMASIMAAAASQSAGSVLSLPASSFTQLLNNVKGLPIQRQSTLVSTIASNPQSVLQQAGSARLQGIVGLNAAGMVSMTGGARPLQVQNLPPSPQLLEALQSSRPLISTSSPSVLSGQQALLVAAMTSQASATGQQQHVRASIAGAGPGGQTSQLVSHHLRHTAAFQQPRTSEDTAAYQRSPQAIHPQLHSLQQQQQLRTPSQQQQQALLLPHAQIRLGQSRLPAPPAGSGSSTAALQSPGLLTALAPGSLIRDTRKSP